MTEKNHPAPRSPRPSSGARGHQGKPKGRGKRILYGFLRFVAVMMCLGIMAVSVGGGLWGIWGMLIGVPLTTVLYRLLRQDVSRREERLQEAGAD